MAIVEMRKLTMLGLVDEKDRLLKQLSFCRCVEVADSPFVEGTEALEVKKDELTAAISRVKNAIEGFSTLKKEALNLNGYAKREIVALEKAVKKQGAELAHQTTALVYAGSEKADELALYQPTKVAKFPPAEVFSFEKFDEIGRTIPEMNAIMSDVESALARLAAIRSEMVSLTTLRGQLLPYRELTVAFSELENTKNTIWNIGVISAYTYDKFAAAFADNELAQVFKLSSYNANCVYGVLCHRSVSEEVAAKIQEFETVPCSFDMAVTAGRKIDEINAGLRELGIESKTIADEYAERLTDVEKLKHLYDYYVLELRKAESAERCRTTAKTFLLTAWLPEKKTDKVISALEKSGAVVAYEITEPKPNDDVPTLTHNPKLVAAFEGITNMYGAPSYREHDPNPFVAVFYFLFFGIMLGDAGYGLVLTAGCLALMVLRRPTQRKSPMLLMLMLCGISTILWGATLGGWFAIDNIGFLAKISWFNPMKEPLKMFVVSLVLGAMQLSVGFLLGGITAWENADKLGAKLGGFCSNVAWSVIMIAFFFVLPMLMRILGMITELSDAQNTLVSIGKYIAFAGVGLLVLGGVLGKKNPLKMLTGIFGNLYGSLNVLSDILSYTRIFGLGLTSGVIGYVLNVLAGLLIDMIPVAGYVFAIGILVVGHTFNLAINTLGAYVHNSRLQFIEFFGHFYDGTGYLFRPLGDEMKYTYIEDNNVA